MVRGVVGRLAGAGDVVEGHSPLSAHFPDARDHDRIRVIIADSPKCLNKLVFSLSTVFASMQEEMGEAGWRYGYEQGSSNAAAASGRSPERGAGAFRQRPGVRRPAGR